MKMRTITTDTGVELRGLPISHPEEIQLLLAPDLIAWFAVRKSLEQMGLLFISSTTQPSRAKNCIRVDWGIKQFALTGLSEWEKEVSSCD